VVRVVTGRAVEWPQLRVELFTNGLLLPRRWPDLVEMHPSIYRVNMFIDAARKETFKALRRGGRWEDLLAALRFVANFRARGFLAEFQANFSIQAANVQEVPAFVRLAKDHRATCVKFALLGRTWHGEAGFAQANVARPDHRLHGKLREVLAYPELADSTVDAGFVSEIQIRALGRPVT
jgi:molybdenum cofactor biosynthesis enzyme MoaA